MVQIAVQICLSFRFCSRKSFLWLLKKIFQLRCRRILSFSFMVFIQKSSFGDLLVLFPISTFSGPSLFPFSWPVQAVFPAVSPWCGALSWESTWANQFPQFVNLRLIQPFKTLVPCHRNHLQITLHIQLQSSNRLPIFLPVNICLQFWSFLVLRSVG